jgi:hypothetical protein
MIALKLRHRGADFSLELAFGFIQAVGL